MYFNINAFGGLRAAEQLYCGTFNTRDFVRETMSHVKLSSQ